MLAENTHTLLPQYLDMCVLPQLRFLKVYFIPYKRSYSLGHSRKPLPEAPSYPEIPECFSFLFERLCFEAAAGARSHEPDVIKTKVPQRLENTNRMCSNPCIPGNDS